MYIPVITRFVFGGILVYQNVTSRQPLSTRHTTTAAILTSAACHSRNMTAVTSVMSVTSVTSTHILRSQYYSCRHYCSQQGNNCEYCFCVHLSRKKIYNIYEVL